MSTAAPIFPPPTSGRVDLLVIAGEHSGDEHAARMVGELRAKQPELRVAALGGPQLASAGAQLLQDMTSSSVVGLVEVLKNYSFFKTLFAETVRWIAMHRPRAVCFVDYPGFNLRLAEELRRRGLSRKGGGRMKTLFYISPQIWAWKAGRRFRMAETLDAMAVIFPFEPKHYADTTLPVEFVGHPFVASDHHAPVRYDGRGPVLLLPGSRKQAVSRIFPVLLGGFAEFAAARDDARAVVLYPSQAIRDVLSRELKRWPDLAEKVTLAARGETVAAAAVLTSSGTMSMHCALAGIPGAVAYRANPVTYLLGRMLVRVEYLGIANLLLGEPMYPEYIQGAATPPALAEELRSSIENPARRERTASQAARLREQLSVSARGNAADWVARHLHGSE